MSLYTSTNLFFISIFTILVPRWATYPFVFVAALVFYLVTGSQRRGIRANLRLVFGRNDVERVVFSSYYHYACNWTDIMRMIRYRGERLLGLVGRRSNSTILDDALAKGTGAILVTPHLGNWELGGLVLSDMGYRVSVLTYREPDEKVTDLRRRVREERGIGVIYVDRNDPSPMAIIEAVNALRRNEVLCLVGDRDGSSTTVQVDFFGRPTDFPAGAAYLALTTGAPIFPVCIPFECGRYSMLMDDPIYVTASDGDSRTAIRDAVQRVARIFEHYIRMYPDQWYTFFNYWQEVSATD